MLYDIEELQKVLDCDEYICKFKLFVISVDRVVDFIVSNVNKYFVIVNIDFSGFLGIYWVLFFVCDSLYFVIFFDFYGKKLSIYYKGWEQFDLR